MKQLLRAREDSADITVVCNKEELTLIDEFQQMSLWKPDAEEAENALKRLKLRYQAGLRTAPETVTCNKWTLYKLEHLSTLLDAIAKHVTTLEALFPGQLSELAEKETKEFKSKVIQALVPIVHDRDPILASALEKVLPKASSWNRIKIAGNARVHLGHDYSSKTDQGPCMWSDFVISDGFVHAGNNYGYQTEPTL